MLKNAQLKKIKETLKSKEIFDEIKDKKSAKSVLRRIRKAQKYKLLSKSQEEKILEAFTSKLVHIHLDPREFKDLYQSELKQNILVKYIDEIRELIIDKKMSRVETFDVLSNKYPEISEINYKTYLRFLNTILPKEKIKELSKSPFAKHKSLIKKMLLEGKSMYRIQKELSKGNQNIAYSSLRAYINKELAEYRGETITPRELFNPHLEKIKKLIEKERYPKKLVYEILIDKNKKLEDISFNSFLNFLSENEIIAKERPLSRQHIFLEKNRNKIVDLIKEGFSIADILKTLEKECNLEITYASLYSYVKKEKLC